MNPKRKRPSDAIMLQLLHFVGQGLGPEAQLLIAALTLRSRFSGVSKGEPVGFRTSWSILRDALRAPQDEG
ncbi:hypothetical protein DWF00_15255 [Bosea caraganae]|uniref:Uncharacterized protein n=1 Tax=Bosea caraganae TaxID=2763117 RepID=A0A370L6T7_9HYPH|nr:hypothetical protein DWE98_12130 [Bosea caraganae]RDJ25746.1 hypothetical protein DWF00_15255 [Bosea caraganae]